MRALPFLLVLLLGGCAAQPHLLAERPAQAAAVPFALNGRVSINHQGQRHTAGLRWTHSAESDEILLLAPLGQTVARIYRDAAQATLDQGDQHHQADDVEALMEQVLGWHLPLSSLHHWVLGSADGDGPARIERDQTGRIASLFQHDWEVRYLRFADTRPDSLPVRLQLNHEDMQVLLLIDEWQWNPQ
jgi:outer membrane lipoprotein LolB